MKKVDTAAFLEIAERLLSSGCRFRFRATGNSMHPSIRDGETLAVEPVELTAIQRGDVLLCCQRRRPIAHRVVHIYRQGGRISGFLLRGDAKGACDAPIEPYQVLGRVIRPEQSFSRRMFDYFDPCVGFLRNHVLAPRTIRQT